MLEQLWRLLLGEEGFGRISVGAAMVIALGGGLGAYYVTQGGAPAGTANIWIDGGTGSCDRSATPAAYSAGTACTDMDEAYTALAAAGDGVACGELAYVMPASYGTQAILEETNLSSCGTNVRIEEAPGETVTITGGIGMGVYGGSGYREDAPDHLTLKGFSYSEWVMMHGDANFITIDGMTGGGVAEIQGAQNITIQNSEFGPCRSNSMCGGGQWGRLTILDYSTHPTNPDPTATSDITIQDNEFHDFTVGAPNDHWECSYNNGGANVTFRRNKFYRCETYAIFVDSSANSAGTSNWVIENNWFGKICNNGANDPNNPCTTTRASAIYPGAGNDMLIRFNSFASGSGILNEGGTPTDVVAVGNILGNTDCPSPYTFAYNAFTGATSCGASSIALNTVPYINDSSEEAMDYHLEGAAGSSSAEDRVILDCSGTAGFDDCDLATDWDAELRPLDALRDSGSDERNTP